MSLKLEIKNGFFRYSEPDISERSQKGKSIIDLPDDYCVIDIETTGLDYMYDSIIEISALRIRNRSIVDSFSSLVKPTMFFDFPDSNDDDDDYDGDDAFRPISSTIGHYYVLDFITKLTGITNEMLESAPLPKDVLPSFLSFIGNDLLVGHNVNFDINFLYDAAEAENLSVLRNDFVDTLRLSQKVFPDLDHHRLSDTSAACSVLYEGAHRSAADCNITFVCFEKMREIILSRFCSIADFKKMLVYSPKKKKIDCSQITAQTDDFDEEHPFYHKTVVFTGTLSGLVRKDAMQLVVNVGGYIADNVTKATNYLVVGSFDFIKSVKGNKSSKIKKAEKMILDGYDITIISENTFREII